MKRLALAAAVLLLAACGTTAEAPPPEVADPPTASRPAPSSGKPSAAPEAPEKLRFTSMDLDGKAFDGTSLAGKPVVLWFWAPWCPKCASEAPAVKRAAAKGGEVAFIGVPGLSGRPAMKRFVAQHGLDGFSHLPDKKLWTKFGIRQQSTFVFMKPDGTTANASGPLGIEEINKRMAQIRE